MRLVTTKHTSRAGPRGGLMGPGVATRSTWLPLSRGPLGVMAGKAVALVSRTEEFRARTV